MWSELPLKIAKFHRTGPQSARYYQQEAYHVATEWFRYPADGTSYKGAMMWQNLSAMAPALAEVNNS